MVSVVNAQKTTRKKKSKGTPNSRENHAGRKGSVMGRAVRLSRDQHVPGHTDAHAERPQKLLTLFTGLLRTERPPGSARACEGTRAVDKGCSP